MLLKSLPQLLKLLPEPKKKGRNRKGSESKLKRLNALELKLKSLLRKRDLKLRKLSVLRLKLPKPPRKRDLRRR